MKCTEHNEELNEDIVWECDHAIVKQYTCNTLPCMLDHMIVSETKKGNSCNP